MTAHELFNLMRAWWLDAAAGPQLLASFRMVTAALSLLAAGASLRNSLRSVEFEKTWSPADCRRFKIISWLRTIGLIAAAAYYFLAGIFELDRTSSPYRLLVGNAAFSLLFLGLLLDSLAWRNHYKRKRRIIDVQKEVGQ